MQNYYFIADDYSSGIQNHLTTLLYSFTSYVHDLIYNGFITNFHGIAMEQILRAQDCCKSNVSKATQNTKEEGSRQDNTVCLNDSGEWT